MGCYHPLKGFVRRLPGSSRTEIIVASYNTDHIEIDDKGRIYKATERFVRDSCRVCIREYREIPCGQCIGCRLDKSREWATRCALEMGLYEKNCFVTLTYDDDHLPMNPAPIGREVDPITGETWIKYADDEFNATLRLEDLQNFMKGLRRKLNEIPIDKRKGKKRYYNKNDPEYQRVRFFGCGEYGDHTHRSHYHLILFNYCPVDLVAYKQSDLGFTYYTSEFLSKIWNKGHVIVSEASWETAAYTARYIIKKQTGQASQFYEDNNIVPEFCVMSRKPGIGFSWYDNHKKCYATFSDKLVGEGSHRKFNRIRYFDRKFNEEYPFDMESIKTLGEKFEHDRISLKMKRTTKDYLAQLETEEEIARIKTKALARKGGEHYQIKGTQIIRQEDF